MLYIYPKSKHTHAHTHIHTHTYTHSHRHTHTHTRTHFMGRPHYGNFGLDAKSSIRVCVSHSRTRTHTAGITYLCVPIEFIGSLPRPKWSVSIHFVVVHGADDADDRRPRRRSTATAAVRFAAQAPQRHARCLVLLLLPLPPLLRRCRSVGRTVGRTAAVVDERVVGGVAIVRGSRSNCPSPVASLALASCVGGGRQRWRWRLCGGGHMRVARPVCACMKSEHMWRVRNVCVCVTLIDSVVCVWVFWGVVFFLLLLLSLL